MKLIKCDRCGRVMKEKEARIMEITDITHWEGLGSTDLCPECYELLKRFIRNGRIGEGE